MPKIEYTEKQIESLFKGIYSGAIDLFTLPKNLYKSTYKLFNSGLDPVFGDEDPQLLSHLKNNIYMFSAAKTFQQVKDMQSMLIADNKALDFKTFKDRVSVTFDTYNKAYLETEYVTAVTSANNALNFKEALSDKKLFPQLKYVAIEDSHTSEICRRLDGTIADTTDKFWHTHSPPNHFNCRCHLEKIDRYSEEPNTKNLDKLSSEATLLTQPTFRNNSGIDQKIFTKEHPYFNVPKKYIPWAKQNFGLEIPK